MSVYPPFTRGSALPPAHLWPPTSFSCHPAGSRSCHTSARWRLDRHHSQRVPGPHAGGREREQALEKHWCAVQEKSLTRRHHLLLQPHPPSFPASLGTSTKIFQESVHVQLIIPCLSNAGEALVPSSTSALTLPGHGPLGPVPNSQPDSSARPWTYWVVPGHLQPCCPQI